MKNIIENRLLDGWWQFLRRHPEQVNGVHETDAELIPIAGTDVVLALTIDTIAEECALGFYREPETIGWMGATASLSDLAAVGAGPVGLLSSVTLPANADRSFQEGIARGLDSACLAAGTHVVGGDTNSGPAPAITTAAIGILAQGRPMRRVGCAPGELVMATGRLGAGGACAARAVLGLPEGLYRESDYRPRARFTEARVLARFATACMDTSDGLIATLDQLSRLNNVGFEITTAPVLLLDARALAVCTQLGVDPLLFLAQQHGEFELIFTIRSRDRDAFMNAACAIGFEPVSIGRTIDRPGIRLAEGPRVLDTARIRNLWDEVGGDIKRYLASLLEAIKGE